MNRHRGIILLVLAALVLRVLVMVAYPPAFWFYGDSGSFVEKAAKPLDPYNTGGLGYIMALKVFEFFGSFTVVAAAQHLAGLLLGVAVYALLVRRGLPRWLACAAAVPVLFDPLQLTLEHYLLSETLFTVLAVAGVLLLLWQRVPNVVACGIAGLVIMMSWFTRPSTMAVTVILAGYLILRRVGWARVVAFVAAFVIPYAAVLIWIGERPSAYGPSTANRAMYSRVAGFVDCSRLELTPQEARLCPEEPLGQRHDRADWYGWNGPATTVPLTDSQILRDFAMKAIRAQPGDYAATVALELAPHFIPGVVVGPEHVCLRGRYDMPDTVRGEDVPTSCKPGLAQQTWAAPVADSARAPAATGLTRALHAYSVGLRWLPPALTTLAFLLTLAALVVRRRGPEVRDAVMLALVAAAIIVPSVLVGMYEARYGLPALPIVSVMAALALHHLLNRPKPDEESSEQPAAVDATAVDYAR
ncbi:hypothetical protein [Allorhizocola rhizosphaerae]|uniref:hypothetical protein n=1 Tax=Allorhizocola rhizosphaerae TaxID=1872709 RepID=UPI000E3D0BA4|nr:hypothetical protein [Allorhizocola rhizosphaerae]